MKDLFNHPSTIKVGFTGTQAGMTEYQKDAVLALLRDLDGDLFEFHHGDCVGADAQAAQIAKTLGFKIVAHPPLNNYKRAFFKSDETLPAKAYLDRNHDIVDAAEIMLATPKEFDEQLRSGTWATIRYSKKKNKSLFTFYPEARLS